MIHQKTHTIGFPIYTLEFTPSKNKFILGGGGGATKAGIKNAVTLYTVKTDSLGISEVADFPFGKDEDGCMNLTVHPKEKAFVAAVNSPESEVSQGNNKNCRIFYIKKTRISHYTSFKTIDSTSPQDYQKIARFSADGKYLATGTSDGKLTVFDWPSMTEAIPFRSLGTEINDLSFEPSSKCSGLVYLTTNSCVFIDLVKGKSRWNEENPVVNGTPCQFRAVRFGTLASQGTLFVVLNANNRKKSFLRLYDAQTWKVQSTKQVYHKPVTAFTISLDGELLGLGTSDMSIMVLSSSTCSVLLKVSDVHGFPVTALDFNQDATVILSGSADGTVVATRVRPLISEGGSGIGWVFYLFLLVGLVSAVLGVLGFATVLEVGNEPSL